MRFCYSARTQNHNAVPLSARKTSSKGVGRGRNDHGACAGHPNDVVLGVLRARIIEGLTKQAAADRYGVDLGSAEGWFRGYNKGHLLDQVLREAEVSAVR